MANKQGAYILLATVLMLGVIGVVVYSNQPEQAVIEQERDVPQTQTVKLYYYNEPADRQLSENGEPQCNEDSVLPVTRVITASQNPIEDTINLLISGEIFESESNNGFSTEFPNPDFKLLKSELSNGILLLEFSTVPGFTSGGSCRVTLLASQITKTAEQFSDVTEVRLLPEEIFQP